MKQQALLIQAKTGTRFRVSQPEYIDRDSESDITTIVSLDGKNTFDVIPLRQIDGMGRPMYQAIDFQFKPIIFSVMSDRHWNFIREQVESIVAKPSE